MSLSGTINFNQLYFLVYLKAGPVQQLPLPWLRKAGGLGEERDGSPATRAALPGSVHGPFAPDTPKHGTVPPHSAPRGAAHGTGGRHRGFCGPEHPPGGGNM